MARLMDGFRSGKAVTVRKTVGEIEVYLFAGTRGFRDRRRRGVHEDDEVRPLDRLGALMIAYMSQASTRMCEGLPGTIVSYGDDLVRFPNAVFIGDTVTVRDEDRRARRGGKEDVQRVTWTNERGEVVPRRPTSSRWSADGRDSGADRGRRRAVLRLRLRALREHPDAFGKAYEDVRDRPLCRGGRGAAHAVHGWRQRHPGRARAGAGGHGRDLPDGGSQAGAQDADLGHVCRARGAGAGRAERSLEAAVARARAWPGVEQVQLGVNAVTPRRGRSTGRPASRCSAWSGGRCVGDRYVDEEHMVLDFGCPSGQTLSVLTSRGEMRCQGLTLPAC